MRLKHILTLATKHKAQARIASREVILDLIRGIAVLLMIVAHAIFFFHDGSNAVLNLMARIGNTVCFVMFLFISGSSLYYSFLRDPEKPYSKIAKQIFKRSFFFLIGFYLIAFMASFEQIEQLQFEDAWHKIANILLLLDLPSFTEFMVPFIVYTFSVLLLRKVFIRTSSSLLLTLELSYILYLLAYALYPIAMDSPWREIKAIFVGEEGLLRFPILQYAPVVLLGMYWGHFLEGNRDCNVRDRRSLVFAVIAAAVVVVSGFLSKLYPLAVLDPINRWPPSVGFLGIGLAVAFLLQIIFSNIRSTGGLRFLVYVGKDAFNLFIIHILLLYAYKYMGGTSFGNPLVSIVLFFILLAASILISSVDFENSPSFFRMQKVQDDDQHCYRPKKRYLLGTVALLGLVLWNLNSTAGDTTVGTSIGKDEIIGTNYRPLPEITAKHIREARFNWFDSSYDFFRQISLHSEEQFEPIQVGEQVEFSIDHKQMVDAGKSLSDGRDLVVVYYQAGEYTAVPYGIQAPNTQGCVIHFTVQQRVYPGKYDNRYFIYFGNANPPGGDLSSRGEMTGSHYGISLGAEHTPAMLASLNRQWFLKNLPQGEIGQDLELTVELLDPLLYQSEGETTGLDIRFEVEGADRMGKLEKQSGQLYKSSFSVHDLPSGEYRIFAYQDLDDIRIETRQIPFYISEPVYVAWTMDWEGWDVSDAFLSSIADQSKRHNNIPITHFFNPRIYLPSVMSSQRAEQLTRWVLGRKNAAGDEIQLHMHMHFDLVDAVFNPPDLGEDEERYEPKTNPAWGFLGGGYDVLTTAYSYEEFSRILQWGKYVFLQNGLPAPTGYRAGGWFADETILQALQDNGFLYDASGRERKMWGGSMASPWNLSATSQPYHPSRTDQNISSTDNFSLLEIPNNGADCYASSAEDMIRRFSENYPGGAQGEKKVIVYLSHAQWQNDDTQKMEEIFNHTDQYLYDLDKGPVIYVTLGQVYGIWD